MLTPEETRILAFLRQNRCTKAEKLARAWGVENWAGWLDKVLSRLEWLGYLIVFHGPSGKPSFLEITDRGLARAGGPLRGGGGSTPRSLFRDSAG